MKTSFHYLWDAVSNSYGLVFGDDSLNIVTLLVILHIFLAMLTLCLGDRTICDILRPLRNIFQIDAESLFTGIIEVVVAIPNAILYYGELYLRTYILALRIAFIVLVASIGGLLGFLAYVIVITLVYGQDNVTNSSSLAHFGLYLFYACWAYTFWRIDGKRLAHNFLNAWQC